MSTLCLSPPSIGSELIRVLGIATLEPIDDIETAACHVCSKNGLRIRENGSSYCVECNRQWSAFGLLRDRVGPEQAIILANSINLPVPGDALIEATQPPPLPVPKPAPKQSKNGHGKLSDILGQAPPNSIESEKSLLGILLTYRNAVADVVPMLRVGDFYDEENKALYGFITGLVLEGEKSIPALLPERLKQSGKLDSIGGMARIIDLVQNYCLPEDHASYFAGIIREMADRRRIARVAEDLVLRAYGGADALELRQSMANVISEAPSSRKIQVMTSAELDAGDFTVRYLVDDILPERQGGLVSGMFKTLKTTAGGVDLMLSLATGTPYLGHFNVSEALPAGIISAESGEATLKEAGRRVATARGLELSACDRLLWSFSRPSLPSDIGEIERFITDYSLSALFIDPSYLIFSEVGDSASNVFLMGSALSPITDLVNRTGCSIVLCNHNRKGRNKDVGRFDPPELQEISMSGYAEWARFWLLFGARREWDDTTASHWLWLRAGGSAGHSGLHALDVVEGRRSDDGGRRWEVLISSSISHRAQSQEEAKKRKSEQAEERKKDAVCRLLKALETFPNGETAKKLREVSGLNNQNFAAAMQDLLSEDYAETCIIEKRGANYDAYKPKT